MNPVSLRPLLEALSLLGRLAPCSAPEFSSSTKISVRRSTEILRELERFGAVSWQSDGVHLEERGERILDALSRSDWLAIDSELRSGSQEYGALMGFLAGRSPPGLKLAQVAAGLGTNEVVCDTCLEWGVRLGAVQKNLFTSGADSRYYAVGEASSEDFDRCLRARYDSGNISSGGRRVRYVSLTLLREQVCEDLKLRREAFDRYLEQLCGARSGAIELAAVP